MIQDSDIIASQKVVDHIHFRDELSKEFDKQLCREIMLNDTIPVSWFFNFYYKKPEETVWKFDIILLNISIKNQFEYVMNIILNKLDMYEITWDFPKTNKESKLPY